MTEATPKLWTKNFIILMIANMCFMFGFNMLLPTLPLYITDMGGTKAEVGLVAMFFSISAIVTRFFAPIILQKFGKARVFRFGLALAFLMTFACGFAKTIALILVFRAIQGIGFGFVSTLTTTLAADLLPDERRGEGIGYFGMGITAVTAISPALGLFIVGASTFFVMFSSASAGTLIAIIMLIFFRPPAGVYSPAPGAPKLSFKNSFFDSALVLQCAMVFFMGASRSAEQNFLSLLAQDQHIDYLSFYYIFQTCVCFIAKFATGRLYDKKGFLYSIVPGGLSWLIAFFIMSFADNIGVLLVAGFFSGAGMGLLLPAMQTLCISRVSPERRSIASSLYFNFYDVGIAVGAISLGNIFEIYGSSVTFRIASCCMVIYLVLCVFAGRQSKASPRT